MGRYLDTSREGFKIALETSVYTFVATTRASGADFARWGIHPHTDLLGQ
jgi:enoyl-[acyl-carrier-protein] reductase (NADH)